MSDDLFQAEEDRRRCRQQLRKLVAVRTAEFDQIMEILREQIWHELSNPTADREITKDFLNYLHGIIRSRSEDDETFEQFAFSIAYAVTGQLVAEVAQNHIEQEESEDE